MKITLLLLAFILALIPSVAAQTSRASAAGQALVDTVFTWRNYDQSSRCRVRIYPCPPGDTRTHTVVLDELAANESRSTTSDAAHVAELIARQYHLDAVRTYWVFHWGAFSYAGARESSRKELFLRATFRRTRSGMLGAPSWRVLTREELEEITDRRWEK